MLGKPSFDEVNPCIVWHLNRELPDMSILKLLDPNRHDNIHRYFHEFIEKYDATKKIALEVSKGEGFDCVEGDFVPLVFRLDVLTGAERPLSDDDLEREKFGGMPNLLRKVCHYATYDIQEYEFSLKYHPTEIESKFPNGRPPIKTLSESIKAIWPKCACCGQYMRFLGQLRYSDWRDAIHLATKKKFYNWYSESSALGVGELEDLATKIEHLFFYCPCNAFDCADSDCIIIVNTRGLAKEELPYTVKSYKTAVTKFMKSQGIHPSTIDSRFASNIPLQFVEGYELNFEVDWLGDDYYELTNLIQNKCGSSGSHYTLFGHAESQQCPKRYMCFIGGEHPRRQAPILSWNDHEHDFTYQIYGDLRGGYKYDPVYCKYDGSCT